jgi:aspartyl-tRNA(Asn)/glutamyl-tRNA(Gln) amidotransferase subunit B
MEEDAGKLNHDTGRPVSMVDFNRTGVPLIEIVSEPDIRSAEAAGAYLRQLRSIVRYLDICDGNLEEGSFRCDANVSMRPKGSDTFGTRTEIKNFGGEIVQETRLWDPDKNRTDSMRGKEEAHDYRYFPDPDLLPLVIDEDWIETVRRNLPELPAEKKRRFVAEYGLPSYDAEILTSDRNLAEYFEICLQGFNQPKPVSNWIMGSLLGLLNAAGKSIDQSPISAPHLARLLKLIDDGTISGKIAKAVFDEMARSGKPPRQIVEEKGLVQISDSSAIEDIVSKVLADCSAEVAAYRNGKTKLLGFFVGQVMKETRGQANPKMVNEILKSKLEM